MTKFSVVEKIDHWFHLIFCSDINYYFSISRGQMFRSAIWWKTTYSFLFCIWRRKSFVRIFPCSRKIFFLKVLPVFKSFFNLTLGGSSIFVFAINLFKSDVLQINVQRKTSWHQMGIIHNLHERLDLWSLGDFALWHCHCDFLWISFNSCH